MIINYTAANGKRGALHSEYLRIEAGGEMAGRVWLQGPSGNPTPASAEEISAAETHVPGFAAARTAALAIREGAANG